MSTTASFIVDAVLFDMDGTLVDSISAVEAAWGKVAEDIGQDRDYVIAATHGKRAIDNLKQFKPHLEEHHLPSEVQAFEESILAYADEYKVVKERRRLSRASSFASASSAPLSVSAASSGAGSMSSSRRPSMHSADSTSSPSVSRTNSSDFGFGRSMFGMTPMAKQRETVTYEELQEDIEEAWDIEEDVIDRSVQILPGVRRMIDSIPEGRYCVATSGAKTYAYGAMTRVGITPPPVTITADDPRLLRGKPFPDPFLLAASCLGYPASNCVVFEDSPSGIRAGVASGAVVVALCTSHERSKIEGCGAHFLVGDMRQIECVVMQDGRLRFEITGLEASSTPGGAHAHPAIQESVEV